jgi:hypothetical protein
MSIRILTQESIASSSSGNSFTVPFQPSAPGNAIIIAFSCESGYGNEVTGITDDAVGGSNE